MVTTYDRPSRAILLDEDYFGPDLLFRLSFAETEEKSNKFLEKEEQPNEDSFY